MASIVGHLIAAWVLIDARPAAAELLVTEYFSNSIVDVERGGDLSAAPRFATGLDGPSGICRGPDDELYVSEWDFGEITIITGGGDFSGVAAFASGLSQPTFLACTDSEILVLDPGSGEVLDVTAGQDPVVFASGLASPRGLMRTATGSVFVATAFDGIIDITAGGDFSGAAPFATGSNLAGMTETAGGELLVALGIPGAGIGDFTLGGAIVEVASGLATPVDLEATEAAVYAAVHTPATPPQHRIVDVTAGGDLSEAPAYATGIDIDGQAQLVYVPALCGNGILSGNEECDDGNAIDGDGCSADCLEELGGSTSAGESDESGADSDGSGSGTGAGSSSGDADTRAGTSGGDSPTSSSTSGLTADPDSGAASDGGSSTGPTTGSTASSRTSGDTGEQEEDSPGGRGCACVSSGADDVGGLVLLLPLWLSLRHRPAANRRRRLRCQRRLRRRCPTGRSPAA